MQLYLPLYLHNECQNTCTYCGFSMNNPMERKVLSDAEILAEADAIEPMGFEHLLLVSGETSRYGTEWFAHALDLLRPRFTQLSIEVQPLDEDDYRSLIDHGLHAVMVYQETYREDTYTSHHKAGKKRNYHYRVQTPDRLGAAGIHKIGLGALIGLEDWRTDAFFVKAHLDYLERRYWRTKYSLSFPRLRPFAGGTPEVDMSDREFVQLICAHRLCDQEVELSLSTRERPVFRDNLFALGFTSTSAASQTDPGGYANPQVNLEQFEISDDRPVDEVVAAIRRAGLDPVWRDWHVAFEGRGQ
jgi:2-iminoacetate synthase